MKLRNLKHLLCAILTGGTMLFTSCEECNHEGDTPPAKIVTMKETSPLLLPFKSVM